jgi:B12-binding domain/radical SAM domain protein
VKVALVLLYRYPGKYAFNVLAGSLENHERSELLSLQLAANREELLAKTIACVDAGYRTAVAFSFYSPGFPEAATDLAWLKEQLGPRRVLTLAGGVHATAEPLETLQAGFDLIALGEGERTLNEIVRRLGADESLDQIPGTARLENGALRSFGKGEGVLLDDYPPFSVAHELFGAIEITRGCVYACRFCQTPFLNKARFRHRSVDNVARWASALRASGRRDLRFISPTSLSYGAPDESVNLDAVEALLARSIEAMKPDGRVFFGSFPSEVRPEHVSTEALAVIKRYAANDNLVIGGQSGSERILEQSHRGHDVEAIERSVRISIECGFVPNVDFILGLPGEEPSDVEATLDLMEKLAAMGAKVHGHTFMPLPGTPFRRAPPGQVPEAAKLRLERLASQGRLYGQWKKQVEIARDIALRRDARAISSERKS